MNALPQKTRDLIHQRKLAKWAREKKQFLLEPAHRTHKHMVAEKLRSLGVSREFTNFERCGNEQIYATCKNCRTTKKFLFACNRKWCPNCNWKITRARSEMVGLWAQQIKQPKHLVLTMRNFQKLTPDKIRDFQKALLKLRRQDIFSQVAGGCCSIEITNAGEGWHLHAHLLLDVKWLDMKAVSIQWGALIAQEFGIVKIKDVRDQSYLHEVTKYVAKGSELAAWSAQDLYAFIRSIKGRRLFFQFGSLLKLGPQIKRELNLRKKAPAQCECGCAEFVYESEDDWEASGCNLDGRMSRAERSIYKYHMSKKG